MLPPAYINLSVHRGGVSPAGGGGCPSSWGGVGQSSRWRGGISPAGGGQFSRWEEGVSPAGGGGGRSVSGGVVRYSLHCLLRSRRRTFLFGINLCQLKLSSTRKSPCVTARCVPPASYPVRGVLCLGAGEGEGKRGYPCPGPLWRRGEQMGERRGGEAEGDLFWF